MRKSEDINQTLEVGMRILEYLIFFYRINKINRINRIVFICGPLAGKLTQ